MVVVLLVTTLVVLWAVMILWAVVVLVVLVVLMVLMVLVVLVGLVVLVVLVVVIAHGGRADASSAGQWSNLWYGGAVVSVIFLDRILPCHVVMTGMTLGTHRVLAGPLTLKHGAPRHLQQRDAFDSQHRRRAFLLMRLSLSAVGTKGQFASCWGDGC
jgi:hypothetical protein